MSYLERILENGEKLKIPNDVELTGQFTATGLQSEPGGIAYYVSHITGKNDYDGKSSLTPAPSITKALTFCRASKGDTIHCLPGHIETISVAGGLTFSKAGIRVFFHGSGNTRATIKFTATASTLLVTAANVELYSPRFLAGIDAVVAAIKPQAADFKIYNAEYYDDTAMATLHAIVATNAANRLIIDGWKYVVSTAGTQKHSNIQLAGGDHVELKNIEIEGDFNVAPIESTAALTNALLKNIYANNVNVGPLPAMNIHANTTGFAKNVKCRVVSGTTYVTSVAKIQWADDCEGFSTDGYGGEPIGTPLATSIEGHLDAIISDVVEVWSDVKSVISDLQLDVWSDVKSVISDLVDVVSDLTEIRSDIYSVKSDLVVADALIDTIKSDLIISHSDIKMINARSIVLNSDMLITHSDVKVIISDLKVLDAIGDTIKSDLIITHSDVKAMNTRTITIASDLVISQSDLKITTTRVVTIASDLVITQSDIKFMNTRQITIASDLVISQSDLKIVDRNKDYIITANLAAAAMTGTVAKWTIANGPILVKHMGMIVTTDIPAGGNTLQFTFTATGLADQALCGATETASAADMQLFVVDGVKATGLVKVTDPGIMVRANEVGMPIVLSAGVIYYVFSAGPPATGAVTLYMQYQKLNPAATVT